MKYSVEDELNFIAWIATNGRMDFRGRMYSEYEIAENGLTRIDRSPIERIELLHQYLHSWDNRNLPEGWDRSNRTTVKNYITTIAIPSVKSMRQLTLGDLV